VKASLRRPEHLLEKKRQLLLHFLVAALKVVFEEQVGYFDALLLAAERDLPEELLEQL